MDKQKFTCQVCGRKIMASSGSIAHHGFKRPGYGWQTNSCEGALYPPYEQSCDRLREVKEMLERYIKKQEEAYSEFESNPPKTITIIERRSSWSEGKERVYEKPEVLSEYSSSIPRTYECVYSQKKFEWKQSIKAARSDLFQMIARLKDWKPSDKKVKEDKQLFENEEITKQVSKSGQRKLKPVRRFEVHVKIGKNGVNENFPVLCFASTMFPKRVKYTRSDAENDYSNFCEKNGFDIYHKVGETDYYPCDHIKAVEVKLEKEK